MKPRELGKNDLPVISCVGSVKSYHSDFLDILRRIQRMHFHTKLFRMRDDGRGEGVVNCLTEGFDLNAA